MRLKTKGTASLQRLYCPGVIYAAALTLVVAFLVSAQITTSSIGILSPSGATDQSVVWGTPQSVRSDEFLRSSPATIGNIVAKGAPVGTPLSFSRPSPTGTAALYPFAAPWANPITFGVTQAAKALPTGMQFAWTWWKPSFIFLLVAPFFFVLLGVRWSIAIAGTWLTWLSAPVQWWSYYAIEALSTGIVGATLVLLSLRIITADERSRSRWIIAATLAVVGGAQTASTLASYIVWSVPVVVFLAAVSLTAVLTSAASLRARLTVAIAGSLAALVGAALWAVNFRASSTVLLETVYPGSRRSAGSTTISPWIGNIVWSFRESAATFATGNRSELAIGFLATALVAGAILVAPINWRALRPSDVRQPALVGFGVLVVFLLWIVGPWPDAVNTLNPLKFVEPSRLLQILGPLSVMLFTLTLELAGTFARARIAGRYLALIWAVVFFASFQSASSVQGILGGALSTEALWISSIVMATVLVLPFGFAKLTRFRTILLIAPLMFFAAFTVYVVNPVQHGTGALQEAPIAKTIRSLAATDSGRWASDGIFNDALILGTGVRQLSGQQSEGPDDAAWRILDPGASHRDNWNRGASYISFGWASSNLAQFSNPSPDVISVAINPCSEPMKALELRWIISISKLTFPCLVESGQGDWQGNHLTVYHVKS